MMAGEHAERAEHRHANQPLRRVEKVLREHHVPDDDPVDLGDEPGGPRILPPQGIDQPGHDIVTERRPMQLPHRIVVAGPLVT